MAASIWPHSEGMISTGKKNTINDFHIGFLGEEAKDDGSRFEKDFFWCVDPLDGTLPFIEGRPGFAVSIALVQKSGIPVLGVIYDPHQKTLVSSSYGGIVREFGSRWDSYNDQEFVWYLDHSLRKNPRFETIKELVSKIMNEQGASHLLIKEGMGAVMNAYHVWKNPNSIYFKLPKSEKGGGAIWDFAASVCLFNESGHQVRDFFGKDINLNPKHSLYMNRQGITFTSSPRLKQLLQEGLNHYF